MNNSNNHFHSTAILFPNHNIGLPERGAQFRSSAEKKLKQKIKNSVKRRSMNDVTERA
jgi:hypothetical protein